LVASFSDARDGAEATASRTEFSFTDGNLQTVFFKETSGSPEFPSYPFENMPWSQTPVVTFELATVVLRSTAFHCLQSVGFSLPKQVILTDHNYTFFGAQYRACNLDSLSSRLPSPGLPVRFTTDLLAKL